MSEKKHTIEIEVNGEEVLMNDFVQAFFTNTFLGSIRSLKDIPTDIHTVSIKISKSK